MLRLAWLLSLLIASLAGEMPWGKDADLYSKPALCKEVKRPSTLSSFGIRAIRFHQTVISPADGPRSHFLPSSSQYTLEAIQKYGFFTGYLLGCDRLMRENEDPWVYPTGKNDAGMMMKLNPVPSIVNQP